MRLCVGASVRFHTLFCVHVWVSVQMQACAKTTYPCSILSLGEIIYILLCVIIFILAHHVWKFAEQEPVSIIQDSMCLLVSQSSSAADTPSHS